MGRLRPWRRDSTAGLAVLFVIGLTSVYGCGVFGNKVPLYSDLSGDDLATVTAELDRMGEQYQISGTQVLVDIRRRDSLRMKLATRHVAPKGGVVGYELLDGIILTQPGADCEIAKQRALQGELARVIKTMDGIADAVVILAIPADLPAVAPTAAVKLTVPPGITLTPAQVTNIAQFIVHAVPKLTENNVHISDNQMRMLYPPDNARPTSNLAKERS